MGYKAYHVSPCPTLMVGAYLVFRRRESFPENWKRFFQHLKKRWANTGATIRVPWTTLWVGILLGSEGVASFPGTRKHENVISNIWRNCRRILGGGKWGPWPERLLPHSGGRDSWALQDVGSFPETWERYFRHLKIRWANIVRESGPMPRVPSGSGASVSYPNWPHAPLYLNCFEIFQIEQMRAAEILQS